MYRVLIVDDEVMILKGLQKIIDWSRYGFEIAKVAKSGPDALNYLADNQVDLVITDVTMPNMSGLEFVSQAFARGDQFLFLILSGYDEFDYAKQSIQLGALNYLMKPIDRQELKNTLVDAKQRLDTLQQRKLPQELTLERALHNQLSPEQLLDFKRESQFSEGQTFCLIVFVGLSSNTELQAYLQQNNQQWCINHDGNLYLFIIAPRIQLDRFLQSLPITLGPDRQLMILIDGIKDLASLPVCFMRLQQRLSLAQFYEQKTGLIRLDGLQEQVQPAFPELEMSEIDCLINTGERKELQECVQETLVRVANATIDQEYVRQIVFWFLATLNRRFHFSETYYNNQLEMINQLPSFKSILALALSWITQLDDTAIQNYSPKIVATIQYAYLNYRHDINLASVADQLHLNTMYLGQLFKQETGQTFNRFLNDYRIEQGKYLLAQTPQSVSEIGLAVGYTTPSYFFRIFKQITGQSPKEYREQLNQPQ